MNFQEENDKLLWNILQYFFRAWRNPEKKEYQNWSKLELDINAYCNLKCKYCYYAKYGKKLMPPEACRVRDIRKNLKILLSFLEKNHYNPEIELFSGEALIQKIGLEVLEQLVEHKGRLGGGTIVVPTNSTFLLYPHLTKEVERILAKAKKLNVRVFLSHSVDGKYCESNRPFKRRYKKDPRDDKYWDRLFRFAKKYNFGFHPMIYSENIEKWKENFLWFQENFKKYGIPWTTLYLLEVRNAKWTSRQIIELGKFLNFLVKWSWNKCGRDYSKFRTFLFQQKGFNILNSVFSSIGRGLGCSIQSTLTVRLGDLAIYPCHRLSYSPFITGWFRTNGQTITGVRAHNVELFLAILTLKGTCLPLCETCLIKEVCPKGCLGAQFETTGDPFSPVPTICMMEHWKVLSILLALREIGILEKILKEIDPLRRTELKCLIKIWEKVQSRNS